MILFVNENKGILFLSGLSIVEPPIELPIETVIAGRSRLIYGDPMYKIKRLKREDKEILLIIQTFISRWV